MTKSSLATDDRQPASDGASAACSDARRALINLPGLPEAITKSNSEEFDKTTAEYKQTEARIDAKSEGRPGPEPGKAGDIPPRSSADRGDDAKCGKSFSTSYEQHVVVEDEDDDDVVNEEQGGALTDNNMIQKMSFLPSFRFHFVCTLSAALQMQQENLTGTSGTNSVPPRILTRRRHCATLLSPHGTGGTRVRLLYRVTLMIHIASDNGNAPFQPLLRAIVETEAATLYFQSLCKVFPAMSPYSPESNKVKR